MITITSSISSRSGSNSQSSVNEMDIEEEEEEQQNKIDLFVGTYEHEGVGADSHDFDNRVNIEYKANQFIMSVQRIHTAAHEGHNHGDIANYIDMVGFGHDHGEIKVNGDKLEITNKGFEFLDDTYGTIDVISKVIYDTKTQKYYLNDTNIETGEVIHYSELTKIANKETISVYSNGAQWSDFKTFPFHAESADLGSGWCQELFGTSIDSCLELNSFDDIHEDGGACFCFYDINKRECFGGGQISKDVRIVDNIRVSEFTDPASPDCGTGSQMLILIAQDTYLLSWKCAGLNSGAYYILKTEVKISTNIKGECPLYKIDPSAKEMGENILENDYDEIVLQFSNETIMNLGGMFMVVLFCVNVMCCWWQRKKNVEKRTIF